MGSLLVAVALALLVIYAGIKLLIQVKKEALGNLYKIAAWGLIVAGKLLILLIAVVGILICLRFGMKMRHGKMKHKYENYEGMGHHNMHGYKMQESGCGNMCCGMNMGMGCKTNGECGMMGNCKMNGGMDQNCPHMMMGCSADSLKRKK